MPQHPDSLTRRLGDSLAKRLWSGDVLSGSERAHIDSGVSDTVRATTVGRSGWSRTDSSVTAAKEHQGGLRRGRVPEHIARPFKGEPRSFNPLSLRKLANSEVIQAVIGSLIGDLDAVPWSIVPIDETVSPTPSLISEAEAALNDLNPNPETFDDVNAMLARDLLEVGNCVGVTSLQIDGRRAEVRPLDPNTFTVSWSDHRVLEGFYQYPQADAAKWGSPDSFDRDEVIWGIYNPTTARSGFYGYSPVEMVQQLINILGGLVDKEIAELEEGMPSGMISLVGDEWSRENYSAFKTYWNESVKGEQLKHPVAEGDAKFVPFNMTYKELQVLDRQTWYAKLVGSVFQVPMSETGLAIGQQMTRATDVSQRQRYKQKALRSLLTQLEDLWTYQYLHRWWSEELKLEFDPGRDLIEKKELAEINRLRLQNGTRTVNEIREKEGLDSVPWGDEPFDIRAFATGRFGGSATNGGSGSGGALDALGLGDGSGDDGGGGGGGQSAEAENRGALREGLEPAQDREGDTDFRLAAAASVTDSTSWASPTGGDRGRGWDSDEGTWLPVDVPVASKEALRETDDYRQFSFQPREIEALQSDVETLYGDAIERVLHQVKGRQELLRTPVETKGRDDTWVVHAEKSIPELLRLIGVEIGLDFAADAATVLATHKARKILDGEDAILRELREAGLSVEDVDLEVTRRRVVERIERRSLGVTKSISKRLEDDLRETLADGWRNGDGITEIEASIEALSDKWTGHEAERLARDQLGRASKEGRLEYATDTAGEVGGWIKTWLATGDSRTRESHRDMDGKMVEQGDPWIVNYAPDGGPARVEEDYPGDSVFGIVCRCDFSLAPATLANSVSEWASEPSIRMREVAAEQGKPIGEVMLAAELGDESRTQAAKRLNMSKSTYYRWGRDAGLID